MRYLQQNPSQGTRMIWVNTVTVCPQELMPEWWNGTHEVQPRKIQSFRPINWSNTFFSSTKLFGERDIEWWNKSTRGANFSHFQGMVWVQHAFSSFYRNSISPFYRWGKPGLSKMSYCPESLTSNCLHRKQMPHPLNSGSWCLHCYTILCLYEAKY